VTSSSALMLSSVLSTLMLPNAAETRGMRTPLNTKCPPFPRPQCQRLAGVTGLPPERGRSTRLRSRQDLSHL